MVISKVIDVRKSAFLEGRGLLDSVLVANEVLDEMKRRKKNGVFFKVDFEKTPTKEFLPKRGLRQDDPLAPLLFLIAAKGLVGVSRMAVEKNLIDSLEIGREKVKVNMLQYADDTLFFCEANVKSVFNIKATLYCFELSFRLKVNFLKSKLGGLGVEQIMIQCFAAILNCEVMETSLVYLGMSVGGCHKRKAFWDGVTKVVCGRRLLFPSTGGWRSLREEGKDNKESIWWKYLRKVWNSKGWGRNFEDSINWKVGYGKKVLFWEDNWVGSGTLKNVFSRLFSLSLSKDSAVTTFRGWNYGKWDWNFVWRRNLFEWEKQIVVLFSQAVQGASFDLDKEDRWEWKEGEKLGYMVKSAYLPSKGGKVGENGTVYKKFRGVFHNVPLLNFSQFRMSSAPTLMDEVWEGIWIVVVNEVWRHRNRVIFKGGGVDVLEAFTLVQLKTWCLSLN
ncbi:uncharacterized protein [Phaseolus vulgaris]|uniref:uncharacterized protein n=1 Tax=Phaseolus vulgaris TaxID=3885 RepID=UPI0035CB7C7D